MSLLMIKLEQICGGKKIILSSNKKPLLLVVVFCSYCISYSKNGTISNATILMILIIGLIAGPAVSL